jgi:hypothetical protein
LDPVYDLDVFVPVASHTGLHVYAFMLWMCLREWRDRGPKRKREDTVIVTAP